ncbi:acyl-CoA thioesterase [Sphingomonas lacunae]|uniref:Acyl-CoA thioesterase n=1 Tax=Sphingomonas lacunae TaxID=2698828 RepID=A0A6M4APZ5_9SPHN|nr:thioesterase family protein [Sphingomonas lacunae]QJQ31134.1 acyl-CoA thioesterase [Sphingomonas lacunae]
MIAIPPHAFTLPFTARREHIDELGHVNNAVWVQWIQTAATSHWEARASETDKDSLIWVVVRHEIDYHRPLLEAQTATAHTWVADSAKGAKFDRNVAFVDADGNRLVTALTTWALIDKANGRPMRVPADLVARFNG